MYLEHKIVSTINSIKPWFICFSAALFFFYEFLQMNIPNSLSKELLKSFDILPSQLGLFSASFFYGNALFLLPAGILLDRYSVRKFILAAMIFCIIGILLFAFAPSINVATVGRFIMGLCNSFAFLGCMKLVTRWIPPKHIALVTGLIVTIGMLGGIVSQTPCVLLVEWFGWKNMLFMDALIGSLFVVIIGIVVRDYPAAKEIESMQVQNQLQNFLKSLKFATLNPINWLLGFYAGLINLPLVLLGALWGSLYLNQIHHLNATDASLVSAMLFVGMMIGSPLLGWISDKVKEQKRLMQLAAIMLFLIEILILFTSKLSFSLLAACFFIMGFLSSGQVIGFSYVAQVNSMTITSTALGVVSVIIMACAAVAQPLFGWLAEFHGASTILTQYHLALLILPAAALLGFALITKIKEV